ncbi:MAG: hypothetical protein U0235_00370 [Polyangiaceae bacterium]
MAERIRASGATVWKENRSEGASLYFLIRAAASSRSTPPISARLAHAKSDPWDGLEIYE